MTRDATESMEPVHEWFGLTYSAYLVLPRLALQEAPLDWQRRFVQLMEELAATGIETPEYYVLRKDPAYTLVQLSDPDDDESPPDDFGALRPDPWADYRRGSVAAAQSAEQPAA